MSTSGATPFACNLNALSPLERSEHRRLGTLMLESVLSRREIEDGYAFELDRGRIGIEDLARWVDSERRCCPFFGFHIELGREEGPLTLRLTGETGIKDFIRAELPQAFR